MDLSVVILAAGKGTRMLSSLPKVLHPVGGRPMLVHAVHAAKALNPKQIIVVYGDQKQLLVDAVDDENIIWVHQAEQKGTGDALKVTLDKLTGEHVLTLYGDVPLITPQTLNQLIDSTPADGIGLLTAVVDDPKGLGRILRDENGQVTAIREDKDASANQLQIHEVNTGIFLLPRDYMNKWLPLLGQNNAQKEYYLTDIIQMCVNDGVKIQTSVPGMVDEIQGVNTRAQLVAVERFYQKQLAHHYLDQGVFILDPNRFDLRGKLTVGQDVTIDINVIFQGEVILGNGVQVGPHSVLNHCTIGDDVVIASHCHLDNVTIEKGAVVGPFARLRPGTVLKEKSRVGNFVEIKNTIVGAGSKVNHLSYVGDTLLGRQVNIGAGTITCNYDGANKHQTIIKDGVHVGSNCQLVAPVTIGEGATLAAGSTITKDAPPFQLTFSHRLDQRSLEWERPTKDACFVTPTAEQL